MKEKERLRSWCEELITDRHLDKQAFDFDAEYDSKINFQENKRILKEKINKLFPKKNIEYTRGEITNMSDMAENHAHEQLKLIEKESVLNLKDLGEYYKPLEEAIEQIKLGFCNLVFVKGRGGIGKSEQINKFLHKYFNENEIIKVTDISEAYLFELFYNNNGCVFWFKDVDKLLRGERSLLTLKTACETKPERVLTNYSYHHQKNLPKSFIFTGKLIFDYNEITNIINRESFEALISRGEYINLNFSFEEMCDIARKICDTNDKLSITEWLIENYKFVGFNQFNLRTQQKAFGWYEYAKIKNYDWKEYIKNKLQYEKTPIQQMLYSFMGGKIIKTIELKKWMVQSKIVNTLRTAERRIKEWLELGEIYKVSEDIRSFYISLNPIKK